MRETAPSPLTEARAGPGGSGAFIKGTFSLTEGQILSVLVGQMGLSRAGGGGGGGSFIWEKSSSEYPMIAAGGGGGSGDFGRLFDFFGPRPLKNASENIALRSFCPDFRAENSHGEPNRARDNFPEKCQKCYYVYKAMISTFVEEIDLL